MFIVGLLVFGYLFSVRFLRWLAIWQQKEYRLDRFWAFFKSEEGKKEFKRVIIFPLKKSAVKRPKFTYKAIFIAVTACLLMLQQDLLSPAILAGIYLLIPLFLILGTIPAWIATVIILKVYEYQAKTKLAKVKPDIIGVSGSYGKTTTKILIGILLKQQYPVWVSPKSHNTPLSIAIAIAKSYKQQEILVMEYASYKKGEIKNLARMYPPDKAVFTGINEQHLAIFGSYSNMLTAETELFAELPEQADLYYNDYDKAVSKAATKFSGLHLIPASECELYDISTDKDGCIQFKLSPQGKRIKTNLIGLHYIPNVRQAINVARRYNISDSLISQALVSFEPKENFITRMTTDSGVTIIVDDRTSNPDGFIAAIEILDSYSGSKKFILSEGIIDLGEKEDSIHRLIGEKAFPVVEGFVHLAPHGQSSLRQTLKEKYVSIKEVTELKKYLKANLEEGSVILVEGHVSALVSTYLKTV